MKAMNIPSAFIYPSRDAPMYRRGAAVLCAALALGAAASIGLKWWLTKFNRAADQRERERGVLGQAVTFRYVL